MFADIQEVADWVSKNPWAIVGLAVLTLVGIGLGIWGLVVTIRGVRLKLPSCMIRSNNLIRGLVGSIPELDIHWKGHGGPIENLTFTKIVFWNHGAETVHRADVVKSDPIRLEVKQGCVILDVKVLYSEEKNQFAVTRSVDKTSIAITFDYIDRREGAVIQIAHTGTSSDDIELKGSVKGAGAIRRVSKRWGKVAITMFALLLISPIVALGLLPLLFDPLVSSIGAMVAYVAALFAFGVGLIVKSRSFPPGRRSPFRAFWAESPDRPYWFD